MSNRVVDLLILAEDKTTYTFLRRYALKCHIEAGRIRPLYCEMGNKPGSGEQFVRERYAREVKARRGAHRNGVLLVHIDADTGTVQDRLRQLAGELRKTGQPARAARDKIAIVVPKRHVETWIHGLCGDSIGEQYDYKRDPDGKIAANKEKRERILRQRSEMAAGKLYQLTRRNAPAPPAAMPSLAAAIPELRRLEM